MVIDNLGIEHVAILPSEADAPLLVDADAVLARAVALEYLELIRRGNHQIAQIRRESLYVRPRPGAIGRMGSSKFPIAVARRPAEISKTANRAVQTISQMA